MFIFCDEDEKSQGYVVIDRENTLNPIVEFSFGEDSFGEDNFIEIFENSIYNENAGQDIEIEYLYLGEYQYVAKVERDVVTYYNLLNGKVLETADTIEVMESDSSSALISTRSVNDNEVTISGYDLLYDCMRTTATNGTYPMYIKSGLVEYVTEHGYVCTGGLEDSDGAEGLARYEVDAGRPSILGLASDPTYGYHAVLVVGYKIVNGIYYYRIADGWGSTADRYIYNSGGTIESCVSLNIN